MRLKVLLLALTAASVFFTYFEGAEGSLVDRVKVAAAFAASLLSILLAHEGGHYIAARIHRAPASLPYFLPLPILSPFGTMGAVIQLEAPLTSRKALLDVAAAGPLSGLAVALPLYVFGVRHATTVPMLVDPTRPQIELGESIALRFLDGTFGPPVPAGHELMLGPVAYAGWAGLFLTMVNLLPIWELDGGHVAYALLGERQNRLQRHIHGLLLLMFAASIGTGIAADVHAGFGLRHFDRIAQNSLFWLFWFEILAVLAGRGGAGDLGRGRRLFALVGIFGIAHLGAQVPKDGPLFVVYWAAWLASIGVLLTMELTRGALSSRDYFVHPWADSKPLGGARTGVGVLVFVLLVLLFMPSPMAVK